MFIPKEEIIIVIDASGSIAADTKLVNIFQRIVWNIVMHFPDDHVKLYMLGSDLEKINTDYYLNLNEKELINLILVGGFCLVEKISKIQNIGPKLFLTDGIIGSVEKRILSDWIITCDYIYTNNALYGDMSDFIPIMNEEYKTLNINSVKRILDEIDVRRKNKTVVCREYESISVL